jgi:UDP-glucose 4-epimerase
VVERVLVRAVIFLQSWALSKRRVQEPPTQTFFDSTNLEKGNYTGEEGRGMGMPKHLVTGGAGFVGSRLVEMLLEEGNEVICVDNLVGTDGSLNNIEHLLTSPNLEFHRDDFVEWIESNSLDGVDTVFHQAASKMTVSLEFPERDLRVNALGTQRLVRKAAEGGVRKVVLASTGSVYGDLVAIQDESHPTNPNSLYGVSKLAGEGYTRAISMMWGLDYTILRYFHVIGSRQNDSPTGGVVPIFLRKSRDGENLTIFGDGEQIRSFTWVDDVARANILVSQSPEASNRTFNCASGIQVTINELANFVLDLTASQGSIDYEPFRTGDIQNFDVISDELKSLGVVFESDWRRVVRSVWKDYVSEQS